MKRKDDMFQADDEDNAASQIHKIASFSHCYIGELTIVSITKTTLKRDKQHFVKINVLLGF